MSKYILAISLVVLPLLAANTQAATDTSIVIQPSRIEVSASTGQKTARVFSIINRSNYYVKFKLVVKDYKQVSDDGKLEFYTATDQPAVNWLIPQYLQVGLKPLETKDIGFVVSLPQNFSAGGHYGAILFEPADSNSQKVSATNFGILVLLTANSGGAKNSANASSINFWTGALQQGNPIDFNFKVQNTGNTHFDTQALLVLKNLLGKEVGRYNVGQLTVYPNTSRVFKWRWNSAPTVGIYRAEVLFAGQQNSQKLVSGAWFVVFPWQLALAVLIAAVVIFFLLKYRNKIYKWISRIKRTSIKIKVKDLGGESGNMLSVAIKDLFFR